MGRAVTPWSVTCPSLWNFNGFLAERLADLGRRRGSRTLVGVTLREEEVGTSVARLLTRLVDADERYCLLFDTQAQLLPEHVEVVLNDRVLDLQGGLGAVLHPGDSLTFLPKERSGRPGSPRLRR